MLVVSVQTSDAGMMVTIGCIYVSGFFGHRASCKKVMSPAEHKVLVDYLCLTQFSVYMRKERDYLCGLPLEIAISVVGSEVETSVCVKSK